MAPSHRCLGAGSTVPRVKLGLLSMGEMRSHSKKSPGARVPKFVGALKVVPKLVTSVLHHTFSQKLLVRPWENHMPSDTHTR